MDTTLAAALAAAATGQDSDWHADPSHTTASFTVKEKLNLLTATGRIPVVAADVAVDAAGLPRGTATLDVSAIDTGNSRRDKDLRGGHFFDTATFPLLTFRSTSTRRVEGGVVVDGLLTVRGEDCPLTLTVTLRPGDDGSVGVHADGTFDRMTSPLRRVPRAVIAGAVHITVDAVLRPGRSGR